MSQKQTRVLSLLATGIAIELILMVAYLVGRGHSERLLSTRNSNFAVGDNSNRNGSAVMGDFQSPYSEGTPVIEESYLDGYPAGGAGESAALFSGTLDGLPTADPLSGNLYSGGDFSGGSFKMDDSLYGGPFGDDPFAGATFGGYSNNYPPPVPGGTGRYGGAYPAPQPTATQPAALPTSALTPTAARQATQQPTAAQQATATRPAPTATAQAPTPAPTTAARTPTAAPTATAVPPTATALPTSIQTGGLQAARAFSAPTMNGDPGDEAWKNAPVLELTTRGGANQSAARVSVQAVYDDQNIYFLLRWADPTSSFLYYAWEKQPDGSWKQLANPDAPASENTYYEDQLALGWYGDASRPMFDLWQWQAARGDGQADDLHRADGQPGLMFNAVDFEPDPSGGGGWRANRTDDRALPLYMAAGGGDRSGAPGYIGDGEKTAFDDSLFGPGERLPYVIRAPWQGDRGDIQSAASYQNGAWTLEIRRALTNGSANDVQFDDLGKTYAFSLATFDNTQSQPAELKESGTLRFMR